VRGRIEVVARHPAGRRLVPALRRLVGRLLRRQGHGTAGLSLLLASEAELRRLNRRFLGKDRPTDVLSFPAGGALEPGVPFLGEIAISVPRAAIQARRAGWALREEAALLTVHGVLHLLGYDHERDDGTMRRLEEDLLRRDAGVVLGRRRRPWGDPARRPAARRAPVRRGPARRPVRRGA
jgi:probable rRNA maturation factor